MEFINDDIPGAQHYTALGVRAGWLAVAQVPLIVLLAGKNNIIGLFTGVSYERLNILHRWVARGLLLLATFHFGFQSYGWAKFGLMKLEWKTDTCPPTGIAAYAILLWMNLTTLAPLRNMSYEFFVIQHLLTFFGFIIAVMMHLPSTAYYSRVYIYIPIVLYFLDRLIRSARYAINNIRPGHATFEALDGEATKVRVSSKQIKKWAPGSFILLGIPKFGFGQSHPATIISTPTSHNGDLVFILRAHRGFTGRILKSALSCPSVTSESEQQAPSPRSHLALIDGPYGSSHSDFAAFDTLILIAGGSGITFTLSNLIDLAQRSVNTSQKLPLRVIDFIWVVKRRCWLNWVSEELQTATEQLQRAGISLRIKVHITCDDTFVEEPSGPRGEVSGCQCANSGSGQCCCAGNASDSNDEDPNCQTSPDEIKPITSDTSSTKSQKPTYNEKEKSTAVVTSSSRSLSSSSIDYKSATTVHQGRPSLDLYTYFWPLLDAAEGETAIATCGPLGLSTQVRQAVVRISDERAVCKGSGAWGIYLCVEQFGL